MTYSSSTAQHCSSVPFSQYDNFSIPRPEFREASFVCLHYSRVSATAAHTAPTSNIFASSLQSGSIRSAGFSPLSFSASTLAPIDSRYLGWSREGVRLLKGRPSEATQTLYRLLLQLQLIFLSSIDSLPRLQGLNDIRRLNLRISNGLLHFKIQHLCPLFTSHLTSPHSDLTAESHIFCISSIWSNF